MKILYLSTEGVTSSVYLSQVYSVVTSLTKRGIPISLLVFQSIRVRWSIKLIRRLFAPGIYFFPSAAFRINLVMLALVIRFKRITIIHCRNPLAAFMALKVRDSYFPELKIIYDVRGYPEGEHEDRRHEFAMMNQALFTDEQIRYSFVSRRLVDVYEKEYSVNLDGRYAINPSAYDDDVYSLGDESAYHSKSDTDSIRLIYIGGNQGYQNIDAIIDFVQSAPNFILTLITQKPISLPNNIVRIVAYSGLSPADVYKQAKSCDYGLIFRDNSLFNLVATPTKITEYLASGLRVLAIGNAGAYTEDILHDPILGTVVADVNRLSEVSLSIPSFSERKLIAEWACTHYSKSINLERYLKLYNQS